MWLACSLPGCKIIGLFCVR